VKVSYIDTSLKQAPKTIISALVLEPEEGMDNAHRRIGIAEIPENNVEAQEWPSKRVVIL
jgi:hypothetical protein